MIYSEVVEQLDDVLSLSVEHPVSIWCSLQYNQLWINISFRNKRNVFINAIHSSSILLFITEIGNSNDCMTKKSIEIGTPNLSFLLLPQSFPLLEQRTGSHRLTPPLKKIECKIASPYHCHIIYFYFSFPFHFLFIILIKLRFHYRLSKW